MVTLAFNPQNKNQLSELLDQVAHGETIILTKDGVEVARITPLLTQQQNVQHGVQPPDNMAGKWRMGTMQGEFTVDETFDDPLPNDIQQAFDGNP